MDIGRGVSGLLIAGAILLAPALAAGYAARPPPVKGPGGFG